MSEYRDGDVVKVKMPLGKVTVDHGFGDVRIVFGRDDDDKRHRISLAPDFVEAVGGSVKIVEHGLPRVGEKLRPGDAERLPVGAVIVNEPGAASQKRGDGWHTAYRHASTSPSSQVDMWDSTLLWLPEPPPEGTSAVSDGWASVIDEGARLAYERFADYDRASRTHLWSELFHGHDSMESDDWPVGTTYKSNDLGRDDWLLWTRQPEGWTSGVPGGKVHPSLSELIRYFGYRDGTITEPPPTTTAQKEAA